MNVKSFVCGALFALSMPFSMTADILELEKAADDAEVDTRGSWENPMI